MDVDVEYLRTHACVAERNSGPKNIRNLSVWQHQLLKKLSAYFSQFPSSLLPPNFLLTDARSEKREKQHTIAQEFYFFSLPFHGGVEVKVFFQPVSALVGRDHVFSASHTCSHGWAGGTSTCGGGNGAPSDVTPPLGLTPLSPPSSNYLVWLQSLQRTSPAPDKYFLQLFFPHTEKVEKPAGNAYVSHLTKKKNK